MTFPEEALAILYARLFHLNRSGVRLRKNAPCFLPDKKPAMPVPHDRVRFEPRNGWIGNHPERECCRLRRLRNRRVENPSHHLVCGRVRLPGAGCRQSLAVAADRNALMPKSVRGSSAEPLHTGEPLPACCSVRGRLAPHRFRGRVRAAASGAAHTYGRRARQ
jgi:hypothetical protein